MTILPWLKKGYGWEDICREMGITDPKLRQVIRRITLHDGPDS